ncbi:chemotaxis protein CheW [Gilvimarinus sp. SDUM040013]|uniref:Chemotaxis protein CheW n=1 Tax=Gilvimarinus gilvus TaxID=3058038 RepID=A0ABU4RZJ0_9GAMM|nr:chemotaxis protein CheW [Gilvimarinus sp. SDUM040013]MDO3385034.1 chemotaxis protein CheW [Gilvimarinus sp. SDUM040013]MDX6848409.1 chemotaxis protein CheW [Gilvimarinus sp. SDUM040013]
MSEHNSSDVLQDYFSDLLGRHPAQNTLRGDKEPKPSGLTPEPEAKPKPRAETMPVADAELLAAKRAQLQKLLHSARVQVDQVAEDKVSVPVPSTERAAELRPTPEPQVEVPQAEVQVLEDAVALNVLDEQLEWLENGRPRWAQETFEVLLFKVSGLTLAVPLISLGQIQPLTDELTPLFGQADWFMGLQPTPSGKVRTVNTARFVMPERYDPAFEETAKYVISINGVPWGLAVDTVEQPISLNPEDVKWRSSRTQRPWLAGTVKAHMCALLDIPMVGKLLTDADRNKGRGHGGLTG